MRIKFDTNIREFTDIDLIEGYKDGELDMISVWIVWSGNGEGDYVGEYNLALMPSKEAKENYNTIASALLRKGFCDSKDFKGFIWY